VRYDTSWRDNCNAYQLIWALMAKKRIRLFPTEVGI